MVSPLRRCVPTDVYVYEIAALRLVESFWFTKPAYRGIEPRRPDLSTRGRTTHRWAEIFFPWRYARTRTRGVAGKPPLEYHLPNFGRHRCCSSSSKGYQGNSITGYGSQKIDIGGLIVGAVVGLGILIFIPKILYLLFSTTNIFGAQPVGGGGGGSGYSGYGRSE